MTTDAFLEKEYHVTPLMLAIERKQTDMALLKIGGQADLSLYSKFGEFALFLASEHSDKAVVQQLIASGADMNAQGRFGECALSCALRCKHEDAIAIAGACYDSSKTHTCSRQTIYRVL